MQIHYKYAPDTDAILILIQNQLSDTVQIHSGHGCHSVTHSEVIPSPEMLHTQMFLCHPFRIQIHSRHGSHSDIRSKNQIQLQLGYAPDTDAIPLLIRIQSPNTTQIRSKYGYQSGVHSPDFQQKKSWSGNSEKFGDFYWGVITGSFVPLGILMINSAGD